MSESNIVLPTLTSGQVMILWLVLVSANFNNICFVSAGTGLYDIRPPIFWKNISGVCGFQIFRICLKTAGIRFGTFSVWKFFWALCGTFKTKA